MVDIKKFLSILLISFVLLSFFSLSSVSAESEAEPDYHFEEILPSDGSNDTSAEYSISRDNPEEEGYIELKGFVTDRRVEITLQNVRKVVLYFNETDIDFDEYERLIALYGTEIDIIIESDTSLLDAEFHSVPEPDEVLLNDIQWEDYSYEDEIFTFSDLEMSTNTITLSYEGLWGWNLAYPLFGIMWYTFYIVLLIQVFNLIEDNYLN